MEPANVTVAHESIVVNAPADELYARWLRFEEFPKFIKPMREVKRIDETHFSFISGSNGDARESSLEIMFKSAGRRIAWRIISEGLGLAVVSFQAQLDGSTEVTLKLRSASNPLLSSARATEYLTEFKRIAEAGSG